MKRPSRQYWQNFAMAKTWDPMTDMPDLQGKVAVVTGAKYVQHKPLSANIGHEEPIYTDISRFEVVE